MYQCAICCNIFDGRPWVVDDCGNTYCSECASKTPAKQYVNEKEMVNHPIHYGGDTEYECIKVLKAWMSEDEYKGFLKGNAIKYLCRVGKKDDDIQELKKVKWYVEKLIESYNK